MRVCRGPQVGFCLALIGVALIWAALARAQTPGANPSAGASPPASTAGAPSVASSPQSAFDKAPKQTITFDPCKIKDPPAYCHAK